MVASCVRFMLSISSLLKFYDLCRSQQNVKLDESELTAAMKLLDKRGSGYVEFDEFVDWWVNKVSA